MVVHGHAKYEGQGSHRPWNGAPRGPSWHGRRTRIGRERHLQGRPGVRVHASQEATSIAHPEKGEAWVRPLEPRTGQRAVARAAPAAPAASTHLAVGARDPSRAGTAVAGLAGGGRGLRVEAQGAGSTHPVLAGLRAAWPRHGQERSPERRAGQAAAAWPRAE